MVKHVIGVILIIAAAGVWFYLNQLNEQALKDAAATRQEMEQMRAEAKARMAAMPAIDQQVSTTASSSNAK